MVWSAWSNGHETASGSGYGFRIAPDQRDRHFRRSWREVELRLPEQGAETKAMLRLSDSFWKTCRELRSAAVGRWLMRNGHAPWQKGNPPRFEVLPDGHRRFSLIRQVVE
jgi:hypothetical protein